MHFVCTGAVLKAAWNSQHQKLTTSDERGLIIVWVLHKGMWFEEMLNSRTQSVVRGMKWQASGERICIAYEDSTVIVGSVDGNRVWGKEVVPGGTIDGAEWSPDGKLLLFVVNKNTLKTFSSNGNPLEDIALPGGQGAGDQAVNIKALHWYDGMEGHDHPKQPTLAIGFENGAVQLMRGHGDENPVLVDTGLQLVHVEWNTAGNVLAVAGTERNEKGNIAVRFLSPFGRQLKSLRVQGEKIEHVSWEGGGLRLALAVDSAVFFANVRPAYKWAAFGDTVAYAFNKPDREDQCVVFWNTSTNERTFKYVKKLMRMAAAPEGKHCVLATATDDGAGFSLILCDAIGSPVDTKRIDMPPQYLAMTPMHVVVGSRDQVYVWQYSVTGESAIAATEGTAKSDAMAALRRTEGRERRFHIDDVAAGAGAGNDFGQSSNPVTGVAATSTSLFVARSNGLVQRYTLPHIAFEQRYFVRPGLVHLAVNCDGTKLAYIDESNKMHRYDTQLEPSAEILAQLPDAGAGNASEGVPAVTGGEFATGRKDTWALLWSEDNPDLLVTMEKVRMVIHCGEESEDPVQSSAYLTRFKDLCVTGVFLDEIMLEPLAPYKTPVKRSDCKSLRHTRELLAASDLASAAAYVRTAPHPRLWRLLAETALEKLDLATAERAYVEYADYQGIKFVKRLKFLGDRHKQRAEVAVWFSRFDEAEKILVDMDRHDLAIDMRIRMGDWFRVIQLATAGGVARKDDDLLTLARNSIGDYYADRQQWRKAAQFYTECKNTEALVHCLYMQDDFVGLTDLVQLLPPGSPLLGDIAHKLQRVGVVNGAVDALLKAGDVKGAIDACVLLNEWDRAVELAEEHDFPQIAGLLGKYAAKLMGEGRLFQAIELFRKANQATESGKLLAKLAAEAGAVRKEPLRAKKLFVLAALEVERHRTMTIKMSEMTAATITGNGTTAGTRRTAGGATAATLDTLLAQDATMTTTGLSGEEAAAVRVLDAAWHGAEAYHFWMLAHRQLYSSDITGAMRTAMRLTEYEDVLDPRAVHSLIALAAYYNGFFGQCSRAFIRLEQLGTREDEAGVGVTNTSHAPVSEAERTAFSELAMSIFVQHSPSDPGVRTYSCPKCSTMVQPWATGCMSCGSRFDPCVMSGRPVLEKQYLRCKQCKHKMLRSELRGRRFCGLCHFALPGTDTSGTAMETVRRPPGELLDRAPPAVGGRGAGSRARAVLARR